MGQQSQHQEALWSFDNININEFYVSSELGDSKYVFENLNSLSLTSLGGIALSSFHFIFPNELQKLPSFPCLLLILCALNQSATL